MTSISRQGIWIDCKALLPLTYQLISHLTNKDRILIGDRLVRINLDMIESSLDIHVAQRISNSIHSDDVIIDMDRLIIKNK